MAAKRFDSRSAEAKSYRKLYSTRWWKDRRKEQLTEHPLCAVCEKLGFIRSATVVNHIVPHKGDEDLFYNGALESVCKKCHDSSIQSQERRGFSTACDLDGYPVDPKHPANRA